jgi:hypothetical protein
VNKDLYGKYYELDENILNSLQNYKDEETISNLLDKKQISYSNLKKIKNRMENGEMDNLGGQDFKTWIDQKLGSDRRDLHTSKEIKRKSGAANAFIKPHSKRDFIRPTERHRKASERHDTWSDNNSNFNLKLEHRVIEELQIINDLIKKLI